MAAIFDLQHTVTSDSICTSLFVLPYPENTDIAVWNPVFIRYTSKDIGLIGRYRATAMKFRWVNHQSVRIENSASRNSHGYWSY